MKYVNVATRVAAIALVGSTLGATAHAATPASDLQSITVQTSRATTHVVGRSDLGAPILLVELAHRVGYKDLDLTTPAGAAALRTRVETAAKVTCADLDRLYPLDGKDENCARHAVNQAKAQVDQAIAAARPRARG